MYNTSQRVDINKSDDVKQINNNDNTNINININISTPTLTITITITTTTNKWNDGNDNQIRLIYPSFVKSYFYLTRMDSMR